MIRLATEDDRVIVKLMLGAYLQEREKHGSVFTASVRNLEQYMAVFDHVVRNDVDGLCFVAVGENGNFEAVSLWGPTLPLDTNLGRVCAGQGTYVLPSLRRTGLAKAMYDFGFAELRARGFTHFVGAVDVGNEAGTGHAAFQNARPIQTTYVVTL